MKNDSPRRTRVTDYLIAIRAECQRSNHAATGAVARSIGVSNGTASSKLRDLHALGLIELQPYTGARLTPAGTALCLPALRRQQLLELFLQRTLPLTREEIAQQAWAMEITLTAPCLSAIEAFLNHPTHDLRGEPILA
jgi:DtxR family transcriptional regulator, Mn-dependent transcriptional regulator